MNNRLLKRVCLLAVFAITLCFSPKDVSAKKELDQIKKYTITVEPRKDGSMDLTYHIEWKVLDSTSEGPLEWVKIGIPNAYVEDIEPTSTAVKKAKFYKEKDETFVRCDLDRKYEAGEVVNIDFTTHQHRLYVERPDEYMVQFTPGWFDDITVDIMEVYWKKADHIQILQPDEKSAIDMGEYYCFIGFLPKGTKFPIVICYDKNYHHFNDDYNKTASAKQAEWIAVIPFVLFVAGMIFFLVHLKKPRKNAYSKTRGMSARYDAKTGHSVYYSARGGHHGGGGGCACACACACAGGGRAGCSRKDFYGTKVTTREIKRVLQNGK